MTDQEIPPGEITFTIGRVYFEGINSNQEPSTVLMMLKGMPNGMGIMFMRVLHEPAEFKIGEEVVINGKEAFYNYLSLMKPLKFVPALRVMAIWQETGWVARRLRLGAGMRTDAMSQSSSPPWRGRKRKLGLSAAKSLVSQERGFWEPPCHPRSPLLRFLGLSEGLSPRNRFLPRSGGRWLRGRRTPTGFPPSRE